MIKKTDKVTYLVVSRVNDKLIKQEFSTFASAAGAASAIPGIRYLNVVVSSPCGQSSVSASLYCYKNNEVRRACNTYWIGQVTQHEAK